MARWSRGGLLAVSCCPACGGTERAQEAFRIADHLGTGLPDIWSIWRCVACASLFLDPRPDDASIPATYASYYTHDAPSPPQGDGLANQVIWALFRGYLRRHFAWEEQPSSAAGAWLCALIPPLRLKLDYFARQLFVAEFPHRGLLLDIGCGNGEFLVGATRMGWRVQGIEPDAEAAAACRAQGFEVFEGTLGAFPGNPENKFDAITSSNCIEHVPDPGQFLAKAHSLLKPGGRLWLATPNPEGLGVAVFGRCWRGLEPSRHLCVPSQGQVARLLAEAGFEDVRMLRRGAHGKTITRDSARVATIESGAGRPVRPWSRWMALPVRMIASAMGTLSARYGEETVVTARRPLPRRRAWLNGGAPPKGREDDEHFRFQDPCVAEQGQGQEIPARDRVENRPVLHAGRAVPAGAV